MNMTGSSVCACMYTVNGASGGWSGGRELNSISQDGRERESEGGVSGVSLTVGEWGNCSV